MVSSVDGLAGAAAVIGGSVRPLRQPATMSRKIAKWRAARVSKDGGPGADASKCGSARAVALRGLPGRKAAGQAPQGDGVLSCDRRPPYVIAAARRMPSIIATRRR